MQLISSKIVPVSQDAFWQLRDDISQFVKRKVLVVCPAGNHSTAEEKLLENLLQNACKIPAGDTHIIKLAQGEVAAWHLLKAQLEPQYVLLMGIHPQHLGINAAFVFNNTNRFNGSIFIPTLAPTELIQPSEMKKALWNNALQPLFAQVQP